MKSIKSKMIVFVGILIGCMCIGLSTISFKISSNALNSNLGKTLPNIATQTSNFIESSIQGDLKQLESIAAREDICNPNISIESKLKTLSKENERIGGVKIGVVDKDGNARYTNGESANQSDRDYFKQAISGKSNVSDPLVSKINDSVIVVYATPLKYNNEIVGVLLSVTDGNKLSQFTDKVKLGQSGIAFMITKDGTTIASGNKDFVLKRENTIEDAKTDPKFQSLANLENEMILGKEGMSEYEYDGVDKCVGYAPINGTNWFVAISISKTEILSDLNATKIANGISSIVFILIGLIVIYIISNTISKGIKDTSKHLELLANGDLSQEINAKNLNLKDEVGDMSNSMKSMQQSLGNMITKIKENALEINIQSENLSSISQEIASVSQNVTTAISDISAGTTSQSEDLINISEILNTFSDKISRMVKEIQVVDSNSKSISLMANDSSHEMDNLNQSVISVSNSFKTFYNKIISLGKDINEINEITNIINGIAEQTNLLALNAAIEAARAGEQGKGFSVVASEIRKLAEQTKMSSENINKLIKEISKDTNTIVQDSISMDDELLNQVTIINHSLLSFKKIIDSVSEVLPKIQLVTNSAKDIDKDKNSILQKLEEASSVAIEISASSEEITASSEEMSSSTEEVANAAQVLSGMTNDMLQEVNKFKL